MAVTDSYCTAAYYRAVFQKTDVTAANAGDAFLLTQLTGISRLLDRELGRFFTKDATAVARVFVVPGALNIGRPIDWAERENPFMYGGFQRVLHVADLAAAPTSVLIDQNGDGSFSGETELVPGIDYDLWPLNANLGPEPEPWTALTCPPQSTVGGWPTAKRIQVTAQWGWPAVPQAIIDLTAELLAIWRIESPRATTRINEIGQVTSMSKIARDMVENVKNQYGKQGGY